MERTPSGDRIVLWSDGSIERVPYLQVVEYKENPPKDYPRMMLYNGQAGLPKDAETLESRLKRDKFNKLVGGNR